MKEYYGGFWLRYGALIIDSFILLGVSLVINASLGVETFRTTPQPATINTLMASGIGFIVNLAYYTVFQAKMCGTIGKKVLGLELRDAKTLHPISIGQSFIRYVMHIVSILCFGMGIFNVIVNKKKQGWHDKVAGTLVVKTSMLSTMREEEGLFPEKKTEEVEEKVAA